MLESFRLLQSLVNCIIFLCWTWCICRQDNNTYSFWLTLREGLQYLWPTCQKKTKQIKVKPGLDHWRNKLKITFHRFDLRARSVRGRSDDWKAQVGKALWRLLRPACCSKQGQIHSSSRLPRDSSRQFWSSWWMEVPAPLWALIQGTTLPGNNFFLIFTLIPCVPACGCCLLFFCYPFLRCLPYIYNPCT